MLPSTVAAFTGTDIVRSTPLMPSWTRQPLQKLLQLLVQALPVAMAVQGPHFSTNLLAHAREWWWWVHRYWLTPSYSLISVLVLEMVGDDHFVDLVAQLRREREKV